MCVWVIGEYGGGGLDGLTQYSEEVSMLVALNISKMMRLDIRGAD